jgi:hypothetical protein
MKRMLAFLVLLSLLCGMLVSCKGEEKNAPSGEEIAKLLIGAQAFDAAVLREAKSLPILSLEKEEQEEAPSTPPSTGETPAETAEKNTQESVKTEEKADPFSVLLEGDFVVWQQASAPTPLASFASHREKIVCALEEAALLWEEVKEHFKATDCWITVGEKEVYLQIQETKRTLFLRHSRGFSLLRYAFDENGKGGYELFSRQADEDGNGVETFRFFFVPGERYEAYWEGTDADKIHWSCEKDRGFWNWLCIREQKNALQFENYVMLKELALSFSTTITSQGETMEESVKVYSPDLKTRILTVSPQQVTLFAESLQGQWQVKTPSAALPIGDRAFWEYEGEEGVFLAGGKSFASGAAFDGGKWTLQSLSFASSPMGAEPLRCFGALHFQGKEGEAFHASFLKDFLAQSGLSLPVSPDKIVETVGMVRSLQQSFRFATLWKGCSLETWAGVRNASGQAAAAVAQCNEDFNAVKMADSAAPVVTALPSALCHPQTAWGRIALVQGKLIVEQTMFHCSQLQLFDRGTEYQLRFTLQSFDENGRLIGYIPLESKDSLWIRFESGPVFTVTQSGVFSLPQLEEGNYTLFATITTKQGIPVSLSYAVPLTAASYHPDDPFLSSSATLDETFALNLSLMQNTELRLPLTEGGEMNASEAYQLLWKTALRHGLPMEHAVLEEYDFVHGRATALSEQDTVTRGRSYSLAYWKCDMEQGESPAYVYLDRISRGDQELILLLNEERAKENLPPLAYDVPLYACTALRVQEAIDSWSHTRPNGQDYRTVLDEGGLRYMACNEILCRGYSSPEEAAEMILSSSQYRSELLSEKYTRSEERRGGKERTAC